MTRILQFVRSGDPGAADALLDAVYGELHRIAESQMAGERGEHTLQPTALVHEAWIRLLGNTTQEFENRAHFFTAAAEAMRRILVDFARRRLSQKRGGGWQRRELDNALPDDEATSERTLAVHEALARLDVQDPRMSTIVKLRYFVDMSVEDVARAIELSERTVMRDWAAARAWLYHELSSIHGESPT
ncbi:MAG: sigma-70 family RNA polymerase sigma factor [Planctomycetota bacterium]